MKWGMKDEERMNQHTFEMINNQMKIQKEIMGMMNFSNNMIISIN